MKSYTIKTDDGQTFNGLTLDEAIKLKKHYDDVDADKAAGSVKRPAMVDIQGMQSAALADPAKPAAAPSLPTGPDAFTPQAAQQGAQQIDQYKKAVELPMMPSPVIAQAAKRYGLDAIQKAPGPQGEAAAQDIEKEGQTAQASVDTSNKANLAKIGVQQMSDFMQDAEAQTKMFGHPATAGELRTTLGTMASNAGIEKEDPALKQLDDAIKAKEAGELTDKKNQPQNGGELPPEQKSLAEWAVDHNQPFSSVLGGLGFGSKNINRLGIKNYMVEYAKSKGIPWTDTGAQVALTGGKTGASQRAQLAPDIIGGKAEKGAAEQSAKQNQQVIDAAMKSNTLLKPLMQQDGSLSTKGLSPANVGELFISTAKLLNATGQLSNEQLATVSQPTLAGDAAKLTQYFGHQFGGATTEQVLMNMYHLIQREGMQAQKAVQSATSGSAQDFTPLTPAPAKAKSGKALSDQEKLDAIFGK